MATKRQKSAARRNVKRVHMKRERMYSRAKAGRGRKRAKPGMSGEGKYFHVEVRQEAQFETFRTHDVGREGHSQRVAGQREDGSWDTQKWLISKEDAHIESGKLVGDTYEVREILDNLGSDPMHAAGNRFKAEPRAESEMFAETQDREWSENIEKAQEAKKERAEA